MNLHSLVQWVGWYALMGAIEVRASWWVLGTVAGVAYVAGYLTASWKHNVAPPRYDQES